MLLSARPPPSATGIDGDGAPETAQEVDVLPPRPLSYRNQAAMPKSDSAQPLNSTEGLGTLGLSRERGTRSVPAWNPFCSPTFRRWGSSVRGSMLAKSTAADPEATKRCGGLVPCPRRAALDAEKVRMRQRVERSGRPMSAAPPASSITGTNAKRGGSGPFAAVRNQKMSRVLWQQ